MLNFSATSLVRPKLEYAFFVCDPYSKSYLYSFERIQKKPARVIFNKFSVLDSPYKIIEANGMQLLQVRRRKFRFEFLSQLYNNKLALDPSPYLSPSTNR